MKKRFIEQFTYNNWANEQVINALKSYPEFPPKCVDLMSHIIAAQDVWYDRIKGSSGWNIDVWEKYTIQELALLSQQSTDGWLKLIRNTKKNDFDKLISYKNSKGTEFETAMQEIIDHVLLHSAYHRGQINLLLRENGLEPVATDLIFFTRL